LLHGDGHGLSVEKKEERERGEKKREEGENADGWVPLPHGVHISKTTHQNHRMAKKTKRF
jgi:hypothetical protein